MLGRELIEAALAGDEIAMRQLVDALSPIIQARVAKVLLRRSRGRSIRQEVEDFTQEIFVFLIDDDGRALRAWDPARGLSLVNFVGLVAERQAISLLRSGRTTPWRDEPSELDDLVPHVHPQPSFEGQVASREVLTELCERLEASLSPLAMQMFIALFVEERSTEQLVGELDMTADAVYAWRSRLTKRARQIFSLLSSEADRADGTSGEKGP